MPNIIIKKIFEEITFFGGISFYLFLIILFFIIGKIDYSVILIVALTIIYLITLIVRLFYFKDRPDRVRYKNYLEKIDASSFPSVHAARATFLCFSCLYVFLNSIIISSFIILLFLLVVTSRIYLKKHDIIDVIGGILLGIFSLISLILV